MDIRMSDFEILGIYDKFTKVASTDLAQNGSVNYGIKMIGAQSEWKETKGKGIKVAILDTGIDFNHPDIRDNVKGGINLTTNNSNDYMDRQGHGTHCAGIVAATLNGSNVVGVAPEAELYAVKVLSDKGEGSLEWIVKGIEWCINNKIHVVSMSLGSKEGHPMMQEVIRRAHNNGIVIVAAAGNDGKGNNTVEYPASYSETIAVAAVDLSKGRGSFSSTGGEVDVASAGVDILSTYPNNKYARLSGTSMACPHIAGAVALLQSKALIRYGRLLTPNEVRLLLEMYAEDVGLYGKDDEYGFGVFSFDRI